MNPKKHFPAIALTVVLAALPAAPSAAWAAPSPGPAAAASLVDARPPGWSLVRFRAGTDPRSTVRAVAWATLISSNVEAAIVRFNLSDYKFAEKRADATKERNADFARRVLATHTPEFAPEVHAAAQYALDKGLVALESFARTGYAAAKERDRQAREATGEQAAALVQDDRDFVALLRDGDPGEQVRTAAGFALRPAATDADVVEFYAHDWVNGAALDMMAFRIRCTDEDMRWRAAATRLVIDARAAEQAARDTAGEAAEQARAAAARAWAGAGAQAGPARVAWAQAPQVAETQAESWHRIAGVAAGATSPNWQAVAGSAGTSEQDWAAERANAAEQAAYWQDLYDQALAGERANRPS